MKALTYIGLGFFYLQYYVVLAILTLFNTLKFIFKKFTQTQVLKQNISPFEVVHKDVFTSLCKPILIKISSFHVKVSCWTCTNFKLWTRLRLKCGDYTKRISLRLSLTRFFLCMVFWTALFRGFFRLISNF